MQVAAATAHPSAHAGGGGAVVAPSRSISLLYSLTLALSLLSHSHRSGACKRIDSGSGRIDGAWPISRPRLGFLFLKSIFADGQLTASKNIN